MILIAAAWLLIVAIALYQSFHGLFSAVIMAILTTICAVFALGFYEWLGPAMLYSSQPAYADALSLTLHFVIPLLVLRIVFDKLIIGNAPLRGWVDRACGGVLGIYIGTLMVGILAIVLQMLPYGASVLSYKPFDSSLQRVSRIYCDEFALGVFESTAGLASGRPFDTVHDDLLLELFCARNTAGLNGRVDTEATALTILASFKPGGEWKQVIGHDKLPQDPCRADGKSEIVIVQTRVSSSTRSDRENDIWYRLPATHFRLVTESGTSLYPLGYVTKDKESGKWTLHPASVKSDKAMVTDLCVLRRHQSEMFQEIFWVYHQPIPDTGDSDFDSTDEIDPAEAEELKAERAEMFEPQYMVFRRTAKDSYPLKTTPGLPREVKPTTKPTSKPKTPPRT
ncbi:MAG: CvpA family protein [Phycisphaerae bacterium]|jgi:hypothetical protein|nr:CvpA family protein [Phycisphaerae bacterium]